MRKPRTKKRILQELLADPFDPRPVEEKAQDVGIGKAKLVRWSQEPEFWSEIFAVLQMRVEAALPAVLGAILSKAIEKGDVPAAKLLLQFTGKLSDDAETETGTERYKEVLRSCVQETDE